MNVADEAGTSPVNPRDLALAYDRVVSAHWRGETEAATAVGTWFESHWSDQAPPEPDEPPESTSILGGAGSGIRWYTRDEAVLGYVSRRDDGCYRVRTTEAMPSLIASWDVLEREATRQPDTDYLLRHTGAGSDTALSTRGERQSAARRGSVQEDVSDRRDVQVLVEADATSRHAGQVDTVARQKAARTESLVAVHVLGESTGSEPSRVPPER
ncbi:MAG: hypothetical protein KY456_05980 [Chloroflexi bacterium]|nr:hypothetical protein [Chloroflexota bacterium]